MIQNLIVVLAEEAHLACGIHVVNYISVLALRKPAAITPRNRQQSDLPAAAR
jgi:hypothetical protein